MPAAVSRHSSLSFIHLCLNLFFLSNVFPLFLSQFLYISLFLFLSLYILFSLYISFSVFLEFSLSTSLSFFFFFLSLVFAFSLYFLPLFHCRSLNLKQSSYFYVFSRTLSRTSLTSSFSPSTLRIALRTLLFLVLQESFTSPLLSIRRDLILTVLMFYVLPSSL